MGNNSPKRKMENPERFIIQMELYSHNLRAEIQGGLHTDLERIKKLFDEICLGLAYIHSKKVVHRDLKPDNILIDSFDHVKIGDFGLATTIPLIKQNQPQILHGGSVRSSQTGRLGSSLYVAPELLKGPSKSKYWNKVDVYSLGITFFELFQPPFDENDETLEIFNDLRSSEIKLRESFKNDHPNEARLLSRMLEHDPKKRVSSKSLRKLYTKLRSTNVDAAVVSNGEQVGLSMDEEMDYLNFITKISNF